MSSAPLPCMFLGPPRSPGWAVNLRLKRKSRSVLRSLVATMYTDPPRPPLPPAGPPAATYFSRRHMTTPSPPAPEAT
ncbi:hypothetical protein D3C72_2334280 [compost metagenome]